jgi:hypothetical protein
MNLRFNQPAEQSAMHRVLTKVAAAVGFTAIVITGMLITSSRGSAKNDNNAEQDEKMKIQIGFQVNPVTLNLAGKDHDLLYLGSYIVNVTGDCNGCHSNGPSTEYLGNPALFAPPSLTAHQVKKVNPATFLGGGRDFGAFPAPTSPLHIFSRNLTPDVTGMAEGGHSYSDFVQIMRTGKDFDGIHPTCPAMTAQTASCVPYPFDGSLLQIMRWPSFQSMTDRDLQAIYEYLSAVPCIDTVVTGQPQLRNTCPAK